MQHICRIHAPQILPNSAYFSTYFASKSSAYFKKILRHKPTSLTGPSLQTWPTARNLWYAVEIEVINGHYRHMPSWQHAQECSGRWSEYINLGAFFRSPIWRYHLLPKILSNHVIRTSYYVSMHRCDETPHRSHRPHQQQLLPHRYQITAPAPKTTQNEPLRAWWQLQTIGRCLRVRV